MLSRTAQLAPASVLSRNQQKKLSISGPTAETGRAGNYQHLLRVHTFLPTGKTVHLSSYCGLLLLGRISKKSMCKPAVYKTPDLHFFCKRGTTSNLGTGKGAGYLPTMFSENQSHVPGFALHTFLTVQTFFGSLCLGHLPPLKVSWGILT
jgi:hypothetical protein